MKRKRTASMCRCGSSTAATTPPLGCESDSRTRTTTPRRCMGQKRRSYPKTPSEDSSLPSSPPQTSTSATDSSKCQEPESSATIFGYKAALSHSTKRVNVLLCLSVLLVLFPMLVGAQPELSLPFGVGLGQSRFMNFNGGPTRDNIRVFLIKNISEDVPVGELLASFRAEDRSSVTYNLT